MFVLVCELQTPKVEHGHKIKAGSFFGYQIDTPVGQVVIFLMVKKKLKSYGRFHEKSMLSKLTPCFMLTFSQC